MSHSTFIKDDQGREWVVLHNGDWSGDATIRPMWDPRLAGVNVPGFVLRNIARRILSTELLGVVETALDKWANSGENT